MNEPTSQQGDNTSSPEKESQPVDNLGSSPQENQVATSKAENQSNEAPLSKRFLGGFIDLLVGMALLGLGLKVFPELLSKLAWALQIGYMLTRDALPFLKGKSIGKMAVGLRAVTTDGQPLTGKWEASIIRNIPFALTIFIIVEVIVLAVRQNDPKRGLRLGDDFAKTKVILSED